MQLLSVDALELITLIALPVALLLWFAFSLFVDAPLPRFSPHHHHPGAHSRRARDFTVSHSAR